MNRLLGSVMATWILTAVLHAGYSWSVTANKQTLRVHEAVEVVLRCRFSDAAYGYFIELQNMKHPDYELHLLFETEGAHKGREYYEYRYVLFPNKAGELVLNFRALMKQTTKASIENSVIGRDNVEDLAYDTTPVKLPPLHLHVKAAPTPLVGEMTLSFHKDVNTVSAYKPLHFSVILEGVGNLQQVPPFELNISHATVFSQKPEYALELTAAGYRGTLTQRFAIVAHEDYVIPSLKQEYWSLSHQQVEPLKTASFNIDVIPAYTTDELLDEKPEMVGKKEYSGLLFGAVAMFLLGFVLGRYVRHPIVETLWLWWHRLDAALWQQHPEKASQKRHDLRSEIRRCRSSKALLMLLIVTNSTAYHDIIVALESQRLSLAQAKKAALKRTNTV